MVARVGISHLVPGETLGRDGGDTPAFQIVGQIGSGGVGRVYQAKDIATGENVVVKIPRDYEYFYDLSQDLRYLAGVKADYVAKIRSLEWSKVDGEPYEVMYLVMDHYPGTLHGARAKAKHFTPRRAAEWIRQIAYGLQATQLLHRDLKPENILIGEDGQAYVSDFGLAIPANPYNRDRMGLQISGVVGTPQYMSPEQLTENQRIDVRSDIYALGLIFAELVTGKVVKPGQKPGQTDEHFHMDMVFFEVDVSTIADRRVALIVDRCCQTKPDARYQDYWDLLNDLEELK